MAGQNPFSDHYRLPDDGGGYDIVPISECVETVKEWRRDIDKVKEELWQQLVEEKEKQKAGDKGAMPAYYAGLYKDADYNNFCFESNVYNATDEIGENIPDDITGWWAVMVDMHN